MAQTRSVKGDIQANIDRHRTIIDQAVSIGAEIIVFPELSLTGYQSALARELAVDREDSRFDDFQKISDTRKVTIGVGAPIKSDTGIYIGMLVFQPGRPRLLYLKQYLHPGEEAFFISGGKSTGSIGENPKAALAICYEMLVPEHAESAAANGARIYIASVANSANGVKQAAERSPEIADRYSMTVLVSNCIGEADGIECAGQSAVWNDQGLLVGQLDGESEGIIVFDTETQGLIKQKI
ncbi:MULTISPECIES: carbon-nitrogen hydrolase family protein [unclassified Microbulbifer]|uniref:carbon-nitrogen hydrolase family protein n=1 Tax=unclassified Microbulbifer TaxID=2619833 RepID=UPI0027E4EB45|nr:MULTISPECIES: carbon-nitrogen hydrolase family protein [unclassified Microbulbifer]